MTLTEHVRLMAEYNTWMNTKIYAAAATLTDEELSKNRGAFFGSIIGTLNHIAVADTIWLKRFAPLLHMHTELNVIHTLDQPPSLRTILFSNLAELASRRTLLDNTITQLAQSLTETELALSLTYTNFKGVSSTKNLFSVLMHVFNHQTHHRGQITTLFSQCDIDVGVTDLVSIIPNIDSN